MGKISKGVDWDKSLLVFHILIVIVGIVCIVYVAYLGGKLVDSQISLLDAYRDYYFSVAKAVKQGCLVR